MGGLAVLKACFAGRLLIMVAFGAVVVVVVGVVVVVVVVVTVVVMVVVVMVVEWVDFSTFPKLVAVLENARQ